MLRSLVIFSALFIGTYSLWCYYDTVESGYYPRYSTLCPLYTTKCYKMTYDTGSYYSTSQYGCDSANSLCYNMASGYCETQYVANYGVNSYTCCCSGDYCNSSGLAQPLLLVVLLLVGTFL